jgi:hypothetical protein
MIKTVFASVLWCRCINTFVKLLSNQKNKNNDDNIKCIRMYVNKYLQGNENEKMGDLYRIQVVGWCYTNALYIYNTHLKFLSIVSTNYIQDHGNKFCKTLPTRSCLSEWVSGNGFIFFYLVLNEWMKGKGWMRDLFCLI